MDKSKRKMGGRARFTRERRLELYLYQTGSAF